MDVDGEISVELEGSSCFAVEFPGYIENVDRALSTMGGIEGLQEQRKSRPKTLTLKLRPEDNFCHPIVSNDVKKSSMMLLRLRDGGCSVCTVPLLYQFRSPADLQMQEGEGSFEDERAYCTPPVFQVEDPIEYAIEAYGVEKENANGEVGPGVITLDYDIPYTPNDDEGFFDEAHTMDTRLTHAGHILREIFKSRPVFLNEALLSEIKTKYPNENLTDDDIYEQLLILCYRFTSGPWRSSWVRKGYDPRKDFKSGKYHVISLVAENGDGSSDEEQRQEDQVTHSNYSEVCSLDLATSGISLRRIHLIDIKDQAIKDRLKNSLEVPSRTCTEECGWHVEFALSKMSDRVKEIIDSKGGTNISVVYFESKEDMKHCFDAFPRKSSIMDDDNKQPTFYMTTKEGSEFYDIIPNEYYESIASNLIQKK